jgi:hypothetical protein
MKNNKRCITIKRLFSVIIIFLISLLICSCIKPSTEKVFKNNYFSFTYPKEWKLNKEENMVTITGPIEDAYFVNIKFSYNPDVNLPLDEFKKTVESQNGIDTQPGFVNGGEKEFKIGDIEAINHSIKTKVLISKDSPYIDLSVSLIYLVYKDKIGIVITTEVPSRFYLKYEDMFNKIINSFKFIK